MFFDGAAQHSGGVFQKVPVGVKGYLAELMSGRRGQEQEECRPIDET